MTTTGSGGAAKSDEASVHKSASGLVQSQPSLCELLERAKVLAASVLAQTWLEVYTLSQLRILEGLRPSLLPPPFVDFKVVCGEWLQVSRGVHDFVRNPSAQTHLQKGHADTDVATS
jgi:hypothetical protein